MPWAAAPPAPPLAIPPLCWNAMPTPSNARERTLKNKDNSCQSAVISSTLDGTVPRHCEDPGLDPGDEAIQVQSARLDFFASLAMTLDRKRTRLNSSN